jgi:hypothetical protein
LTWDSSFALELLGSKLQGSGQGKGKSMEECNCDMLDLDLKLKTRKAWLDSFCVYDVSKLLTSL